MKIYDFLLGILVFGITCGGLYLLNKTDNVDKEIRNLNNETNILKNQLNSHNQGVAETIIQLEVEVSDINTKLTDRIKSIDAALNSKSKRWEEIKKIRNIAKNTIKTSRYPSRMNIVDLTRYATAVVDFSSEYDVSIPLILAVTRQESAFNPKAVSHAGAQGLMQLMPRTALECSDEIGKRFSNIFHIGTNVQFGTFYLRKMLTRFKDDIELAIKAYNAGPNYVTKVLANEYRSYPSETINYSKKVLEYLKEYKTAYN
jgi:soluble lytic murein transglycosylase-like protein